ncbi:hypothetical protein F4604DRAFT_517398 [Suillus subluteus]|nr:hypothetical protein F4604DRAFT_517398 [Suillus subluteus]
MPTFTLSLEGFGRVITILGRVIPIRLRRQGRTQHNTRTADHEDSSIPTDLSSPVPGPIHPSNSSPMHPVSASSEPGLEEPPTGFPSAEYPFGTSPAREALDIAQVALPLVQAFTGVIPLVGAPINAAIDGLLQIFQDINNKAALDELKSRLDRLHNHLCNAPPALDPLELARRDLLARKLQDTSARLKKLQKRRLAYTSVTQAITGCSTDIDRYLVECLWSSQMQSQRETHELLIISRRRQEGSQNIEQSFAAPSASHLAGIITPGCVTLVDATGHHHPISVNFCASYQQLDKMLRVLFERDAIEAKIQRRYIEEGKYDLCIDRGTQIVMRVTIQQMTSSGSDVDYQCHFCGTVNRLSVGLPVAKRSWAHDLLTVTPITRLTQKRSLFVTFMLRKLYVILELR